MFSLIISFTQLSDFWGRFAFAQNGLVE
jgi:hypothetical protein